MKIKLTLIIFLAALNGCSSAQQKQAPDFCFQDYASPEALEAKRDSSLAFVNLVLNNEFEAAEKLYPAIFKIDVAPGMSEGPGYEPYLAEVGEFVYDYTNTYDIVPLAVFLENRYNSHNNVYDMLLRGSLRADSANVAAMFLLAKLRYENNITDDAYFLVQHMMKLEPENKKVRELHAWFQDNHEPLGMNLPSFDRFVREKVYYRELD
ncbi:hypothetical protein [Pontibacter arcticus]|uniref:Uncharacterized protein n=1 Tax=Pontibacter arcticus TaxID=2080288 RepID=A0A364RFV2_9BACT|nr:hypothetical protein [Pontibacter arcticus]RAU83154.1 hypothetical protein DP923_07965 [Pontibacter arcticus]